MRPTALILIALLLVGCSDAFDPFAASDRTFALYGFLDARRDTQFVRVQPITEATSDDGTVDANVTSTDLATDEALVWQDSLVQLDDGDPGTVFFAVFRPRAGRTYRIEATQPAGGAASRADVTLPAAPPFRAAAPDTVGIFVSQTLTVGSTRPPSDMVVTYTVRPVGAEEPVRFDVPYEVQSGRREDGFAVVVSLSRDAGVILSSFEEDAEVALLDLQIAYALEDEPPAPVVGGIGQVGTAAAFTDAWTLPSETVEQLGLVDAQGEK